MSSDSFKVIYRARNTVEADALKSALEEAGIRAMITNAVLEGGSGVDSLGWPTLPRIAVPAEDAELARLVALEFDRSLVRASRPETEPSSEEPDSGFDFWWPRCPECSKPRLMQCPFCGTAGTDFRPADQVEAPSEAEQPAGLVICPTCDEAMKPQFLRECEWCGHRFTDGLEPRRESSETDGNWRPLLALLVVGAILVALVVYFASLL